MNLLKSFFQEIAVALRTDAELSAHLTPRAREMFALAQDEATRLNHNFIGTEHVLLGLLKLDQGVAANVLTRQCVDLSKVRARIDEYVGHAPDAKILNPIPFTPRVKRILVTAQKEARELNHAYVGTEHILLGLLSENDSVAARVLENLGLCLSQIRREILKELDPNLYKGEQPSQG